MTKNPFLNALSAVAYIAIVASIMFYGMARMPAGPDKSVAVPIAVLSLFTLSAAVMAYIFVSQPLQLYLDGKKKIAINLFLQTLAVFAGITALIFILLYSRILF